MTDTLAWLESFLFHSAKISENGYTGKLRPINMHMPAYIGIWFMMKSANNGQDSAIKKLSDAIEDSGINSGWMDVPESFLHWQKDT